MDIVPEKKKSRTFLDVIGLGEKNQVQPQPQSQEQIQANNPFSVVVLANTIIDRKKKLKEITDSM